MFGVRLPPSSPLFTPASFLEVMERRKDVSESVIINRLGTSFEEG